LSKGVKKLCYVSSTAALGDLASNETIITEEIEWNPKPHSDYAISKYGAEMEIWRGQQEGLDVIIVNPGIINSQEANF
jgi:nucleoside-diphosphate-sugar epimerase